MTHIQNLFNLIRTLSAERLTRIGLGKKAQRRAKQGVARANPGVEDVVLPFVQHTNPQKNDARKARRVIGARQQRKHRKALNRIIRYDAATLA